MTDADATAQVNFMAQVGGSSRELRPPQRPPSDNMHQTSEGEKWLPGTFHPDPMSKTRQKMATSGFSMSKIIEPTPVSTS